MQVDRLSSSQNHIWALWGNPTAAGAPKSYTLDGSTWSDGYLAVWHLNKANMASKFEDATANNFDGVQAGVTDTAGVIAGGQNFSGNDADIDITGIALTRAAPNRNYTFSFWFKGTSTETEERILDIYTGRCILQMNAGGLQYYDGTWRGPYGSGFNNGSWRYATYLLDDGSKKGAIYVDAAPIQTGITYTPQNLGGSARIGTEYDGTGTDFDGQLDEFRISTVVRSTNWLWAAYMTSGFNGDFTAYDILPTSQGSLIMVR